ncbi:MAG: hypothetical protein V7K89_09205 [Nostoc sp.]
MANADDLNNRLRSLGDRSTRGQQNSKQKLFYTTVYENAGCLVYPETVS